MNACQTPTQCPGVYSTPYPTNLGGWKATSALSLAPLQAVYKKAGKLSFCQPHTNMSREDEEDSSRNSRNWLRGHISFRSHYTFYTTTAWRCRASPMSLERVQRSPHLYLAHGLARGKPGAGVPCCVYGNSIQHKIFKLFSNVKWTGGGTNGASSLQHNSTIIYQNPNLYHGTVLIDQ